MAQPWEQHHQRISVLMERYPDSERVLRSYQKVLEFQRKLADHIEKHRYEISVVTLRDISRNLHVILPFFPIFLDVVGKEAASALALGAKGLGARSEAWEDILNEYLITGMQASDPSRRFLIKTFLQPLMVHLAHEKIEGVSHSAEATLRSCPFCGEYPAVAYIRSAEDAEQQYRVCSLCLTEWRVPARACMFCNETRQSRLPHYASEDVAHVQITACDTCKRYIKIVNLADDREAIPIVEDLATQSLDTLMRERGYHRSEMNLAGV